LSKQSQQLLELNTSYRVKHEVFTVKHQFNLALQRFPASAVTSARIQNYRWLTQLFLRKSACAAAKLSSTMVRIPRNAAISRQLHAEGGADDLIFSRTFV
jgi:Tfp pilus assembly PilM family ATPase